jgi:hypothetical protein
MLHEIDVMPYDEYDAQIFEALVVRRMVISPTKPPLTTINTKPPLTTRRARSRVVAMLKYTDCTASSYE